MCVFLAARRNIWNFPIGIAKNVVFIVPFVGAALYADAGLQVVYLVLGAMGWVAWAPALGNRGGLRLPHPDAAARDVDVSRAS